MSGARLEGRTSTKYSSIVLPSAPMSDTVKVSLFGGTCTGNGLATASARLTRVSNAFSPTTRPDAENTILLSRTADVSLFVPRRAFTTTTDLRASVFQYNEDSGRRYMRIVSSPSATCGVIEEQM